MKASRTLPDNYSLFSNLDLKHETRLNVILQVAGLILMALAGWLLTLCVFWLRPEFSAAIHIDSPLVLLKDLLVVIVIMVLVIILHELVHGLFFWLFSGSRPKFGLGVGYAFAALPEWYFPRGQYLVIGLSPLVGLTVLGLAVCAFIPLAWLGALLAGMVINAGGAIGDMYVCWLVARAGGEVWVRDSGDGFQIYRRARTNDSDE